MPGQTNAITAKMIANTPRIARAHQLPIRTCTMPIFPRPAARVFRSRIALISPDCRAADRAAGYRDRQVRLEIGYRRTPPNRGSAVRQIRARCGVAVISEATKAFVDRVAAEAQRFETPCGDGRLVWHSWGSGPTLVLLH